jgi:putative transposase
MATDKQQGIADEVVDQLLEGRDPATVFESGGLIDELKKRLAERMLNAELDHHLTGAAEEAAGNYRNGYSQKTVITDSGKIELSIPRDRHGRFDPVLIGKYRRRFAGFDEKIIALYARGMTTREIAEHVGELYGAEISPDLVSAVTDAVLEEVGGWQSRGLDATYAIVFFDAIRVKIRNEGMVSNRAVYLAIGIRCSGHKEILGIWIEQTEGAKFWLRVMSELKNRGVQDLLIAVVDGLKGFPEAITAVFPKTVVQTCIVHLIRYSMQFVSWKERKLISAALKPIYQAESAAAARERLEDFDAGPWGQKYPAIAQSWRRNWEQVIPFFAFAPELRKIIYTTNAIESLNAEVRKAVRIRGHFPSEEAATKLIYLVPAQGSGALEKSADFLAGCQGAIGDSIRGALRGGAMKMAAVLKSPIAFAPARRQGGRAQSAPTYVALDCDRRSGSKGDYAVADATAALINHWLQKHEIPDTTRRGSGKARGGGDSLRPSAGGESVYYSRGVVHDVARTSCRRRDDQLCLRCCPRAPGGELGSTGSASSGPNMLPLWIVNCSSGSARLSCRSRDPFISSGTSQWRINDSLIVPRSRPVSLSF